jgi:hypothetical protein
VTSDSTFFTLPGVNLSASYQMHVLDSTWNYFNWADAETGQETLAMLLTISNRFQDYASAYTLRSRLDAVANEITVSSIDTGDQRCMEFAQALIYFTAIGSISDRETLPLDIAMPAKKLVVMRSSWSDPKAIFVGIKANNCSWNHGDLDSGSFVYSSNGQRFISDLGADNYDLPNYFGNKRFNYYRKNSHGHNVLSFGNALHDAIDCFATIKTNATTTFINSFNSTNGIITPSPVGHELLGCILESNESSCTVIDMTASFALQGVMSASRRFALSLDRSILYLSDRWILNSSTSFNATSSFHTFATVMIPSDSRSAILTLGGESITLQFSNKGECNALAKFSSTEIHLEPPENSSVGLIRIDAFVESASICNGLDIEIIR